MSNHQDTAKAFLKIAGTGNVQEAYDRYVAPSFIHHNQYFKGDRQSLLTAMQEASKTSRIGRSISNMSTKTARR
jgi:hypothetical protein